MVQYLPLPRHSMNITWDSILLWSHLTFCNGVSSNQTIYIVQQILGTAIILRVLHRRLCHCPPGIATELLCHSSFDEPKFTYKLLLWDKPRRASINTMKLMFEFWPPEWINELITKLGWEKKEVMPGSMFTVEDVEYFGVFQESLLPSRFSHVRLCATS